MKITAWPRADGLVEVEWQPSLGLGMWRGTPSEAEIFIKGIMAGVDMAERVARNVFATEFDDVRPVEEAPPFTPMRHRCETCGTVDGHDPICPENNAP